MTRLREAQGRLLEAIREDADALDSVLREMRFSGRYA